MVIKNKTNLKCANCNYCPDDLNELFYDGCVELGIGKEEEYILCEMCLETYD